MRNEKNNNKAILLHFSLSHWKRIIKKSNIYRPLLLHNLADLVMFVKT